MFGYRLITRNDRKLSRGPVSRVVTPREAKVDVIVPYWIVNARLHRCKDDSILRKGPMCDWVESQREKRIGIHHDVQSSNIPTIIERISENDVWLV